MLTHTHTPSGKDPEMSLREVEFPARSVNAGEMVLVLRWTENKMMSEVGLTSMLELLSLRSGLPIDWWKAQDVNDPELADAVARMAASFSDSLDGEPDSVISDEDLPDVLRQVMNLFEKED